ncbi:MAG: amino acid permease [Bacillota bacterium]|nr:amino acid permease [Bacillota bacterium]
MLGPWDLTFLGLGGIIGTGIFVLTGVAAARFAGPAVVISFVISGLAATLTAFVYAELASMVPVAGSAYTYAYSALGELPAWIIGWDLILEYTVAASAVAIGWASYLTSLLANLGAPLPHALTAGPWEGGLLHLPALLVVMGVTALLVLGTRESATFNLVVVAAKLVALALFIALGAGKVNPVHWIPFAPYGVAGIVRAAAIVFFAYIGFDAVSTAAEEVRRPARDLPIGILASLGIATTLYLVVAAILTGILPYPHLDTASPVATALAAAGYRWASAAVSVGALAGLTSVLVVNIFAQSRIFFAMAGDGLLPPLFARVARGRGTPTVSIFLTGGAVALMASLLPIGTVAELANIGTLAAFVLVSAGVIALRRTRPDLPRPFRVPWVPWFPALAAMFCLYLMANLPVLTWVRFGVWLAAGLTIYSTYSVYNSRLARQPVPAAHPVPRPAPAMETAAEPAPGPDSSRHVPHDRDPGSVDGRD